MRVYYDTDADVNLIKGKKPQCAGCGFLIERNEERIRVKVAKTTCDGRTVSDTAQFHCKARCVWKVKRSHNKHCKELMDKSWPQSSMSMAFLVNELDTIDEHGGFSDSSSESTD